MTGELPIVYPQQPNPPPRPTSRDAKVRRAGVELILPEVIEWLGADWREDQRDDYISDLLEVVDCRDGYRAAHALEHHHHWSPDEALVDILSMLSTRLSEAEGSAVRLWAEANGVRAKLTLGAQVSTPHGVGPIVDIREAEAVYIVRTPDCHAAKLGTRGGVLVPYERCKPVEATAVAA